MSRHKNPETPTQINVTLPENLVRKVRILLLDPVSGRVKYGAMNGLVERLLRKWLRDIEQGSEQMPEIVPTESEEKDA